jgi:acetyltransferase-like isoleucine patch superfamily enzyme
MKSAIRSAIKRALDICSLVAVAPGAAMCKIESAASRHGDAAFVFWAQAFALVPGLPGVFLRRAFYRLTLDHCASSFHVGFGALMSHRNTTIEQDVYIGPYAVIGSARLRRGCLIGTRASILSGTALHSMDRQGRWLPTDPTQVRQVEIGEYAWIGEAAIVMADVGASAMVGAGSVASSRVPSFVVVAGNPARFARRLTPEGEEETESAAKTVSIC